MKGDKPAEKKQTLVPAQTITNPIDTSIGSYQLDNTVKENIVLAEDTIEKIAVNTSLSNAQAIDLKRAIDEIGKNNLKFYKQIIEKNPSLNDPVNNLRTNGKVRLKRKT